MTRRRASPLSVFGQRTSRGLDDIEQVGDSRMVGLEAVHDWPNRGVDCAERRNSS